MVDAGDETLVGVGVVRVVLIVVDAGDETLVGVEAVDIEPMVAMVDDMMLTVVENRKVVLAGITVIEVL